MADVPLAKSPVPVDEIDATGTPSSSTFLRGDGAWETPAGGGGGGGLVDVDQVVKSDGNIGVANTGGSTVDLDSSTDLTLDASSGDRIEVGLSAFIEDPNGWVWLDVATLVSGSPVTYASTGTGTNASAGVAAWGNDSNAGTDAAVGGSVFLPALTGSDIDTGVVTLRFRTTTTGTATVRANTGRPLIVWAKNYGSV